MPNRNIKVMNSSASHDWATPQEFVDGLPFDFTLDCCATLESTKCAEYISPNMDALREDRRWPGVVWMNPPFNQVEAFIEKAAAEAKLGSVVVCLVPARTETKWFHTVWAGASLICFVGRRIKFSLPGEEQGDSAPFPNVLAVFGELPNKEPPSERPWPEPHWYAQELSKIGTVILPGFGNIWLHGEKG